MKPRFSEAVERGRVTSGQYASNAGEPFGFFLLVHPRTGRKFKVMVGDGLGWDHVSVSLRDRCPTWEEMCWVKAQFFEPEEAVVQYHPPASKHINISATCLHLWRPQTQPLAMPPEICV